MAKSEFQNKPKIKVIINLKLSEYISDDRFWPSKKFELAIDPFVGMRICLDLGDISDLYVYVESVDYDTEDHGIWLYCRIDKEINRFSIAQIERYIEQLDDTWF
jgi:hypothetical protein